MNLFTYGTLMTVDGFREALGERASALTFRVARLEGWRRIWNASREEWGGGVLNVERHPGAFVVGVLVGGLGEEDVARLDAQEATHLPREPVWVEVSPEELVEAQMYWRRRGNYTGPPSPRYEAVVLARARDAGSAAFENLRSGSVDAAGEPVRLSE